MFEWDDGKIRHGGGCGVTKTILAQLLPMQPIQKFAAVSPEDAATPVPPQAPQTPPAETGGPKGPEPTRFGDWEKNGRCIDF